MLSLKASDAEPKLNCINGANQEARLMKKREGGVLNVIAFSIHPGLGTMHYLKKQLNELHYIVLKF